MTYRMCYTDTDSTKRYPATASDADIIADLKSRYALIFRNVNSESVGTSGS